MTAHTPLEQALVAWNHNQSPSTRLTDTELRQLAVEDAESLFETGVFSIRHIMLITGLPQTFIYELLSRKSRTGGKFNPEALPMLYDLWLQWAQARTCDKRELTTIVKLGVSPLMIERLVGIPKNTVASWTKEKK